MERNHRDTGMRRGFVEGAEERARGEAYGLKKGQESSSPIGTLPSIHSSASIF